MDFCKSEQTQAHEADITVCKYATTFALLLAPHRLTLPDKADIIELMIQ